MPLKKLTLRPGVNRENTRYTAEDGWYECDKIRFRQGTPEKIGGWSRISTATFLGVCRSLWNWITNGGLNLLGVGTNIKFYVERGGVYYDITPLRATVTLNGCFTATDGSNVITVTDTAHGCATGDYVTFSGATSLGGNITAAVLNAEYAVTVTGVDSYTITVGATANATDAAGSPGGGAAVSAAYQIPISSENQAPITGWSAGGWGSGAWGTGTSSALLLRLWSQMHFGEDLIINRSRDAIYYWDSSAGVGTRAVELSTMAGASDVPTIANFIYVSDINRFVFAFGCNEVGSAVQDPLLVRWSDQESAVNWTPSATTQSGSLRLTHGSELRQVVQTRQELFVLTDSAVYSLQYLGGSDGWGAQMLADNVSVISENSATVAAGIIYWMGIDKFYVYDGRVQTLPCTLRRFVFTDFNHDQAAQVCAGTSEGFNEIWWFYPSAGSSVNDRYVIYNYLEKLWYYGTMGRTAWLDTSLRNYPVAATYSNNIVSHEYGVDDNTSGTPTAIEAYVTSSEFDIQDGEHFGFIWRVLPDVTFEGSSAASPAATLSLTPLKNSGSGYTSPASVGGTNSAAVTRTVELPIEEFTGQIYVRLRGRQMVMKMHSTALGVAWQMGATRIDLRPDGRR